MCVIGLPESVISLEDLLQHVILTTRHISQGCFRSDVWQHVKHYTSTSNYEINQTSTEELFRVFIKKKKKKNIKVL